MKILKRLLAILLISLAIILAASFITLKRGISISELSISNIQISNTHFIWNKKLELEVEKIAIQPAKDQSSSSVKPSYIRYVLQAVNLIEKWFASIDIKQITFGSLKAGFHYQENKNGQLTVNSPQLEMQSRISTDDNFLVIDIEKIKSLEYNSHAKGQIRIDTQNTQLKATIEAILADTLPLHLIVEADRKQLSFSGQGKKPIASIAPIVELFHLGPGVSPWIVDYLSASEFSLTSISGSIPYENPESILQTLHAVASIKDAEYTFVQGLEPIKASEIIATFEKGMLKIQPHEAHFYGQDAGNSELDINFNNAPFILTAYIRTNAQASGGVLTLLDHYGIALPFEQKEGLTDIDLTLAINLSTIDIQTKGTFQSDDSIFEFDKQLINVDHLDISLNNTDITIHQLDTSIKDIYSARITGELDAAKHQGNIKASIDRFSYLSGHSALQLDNPDNKPINVQYHMRPDGDTVSVTASRWKLDDNHLDIGKLDIPINLETWSANLPPTSVAISPWLKTKISGTLKRQLPYADLDVTLLDLTYDAIRMEQPEVKTKLVIGDDISLTTKKSTVLSMGSTKIKILPTEVIYGEKKLRFKQSGLEVAGQFFSDIKGDLDFKTQTGNLTLDKVRVTDAASNNLLVIDRPLMVKLSLQKNRTNAVIPMLGVEFKQHDQKAWSVSLKDFGKLYPYSPVMQRYKLKKGEISLASKKGSLPYSFSGKLSYPDALLIESGTPVHDYNFSGNYSADAITIDVNGYAHLKLADRVTISSNNVGYSLPALISASKDQSKPPESKNSADSKAFALTFNAKNSFISLSDKSQIVADELTVTVDQGTTKADLKFGDGFASMQIKDNKLSLIGKKFDVTFLNELLGTPSFDKGDIEFQASGSLDSLNAVFRLEETIVKDFKTLDNTLAFIDTVPDLLTFRVPDYSEKGLPVHEIYVGAKYNNGLVEVKTAHLDSDELNVRGAGELSPKQNSIDMTLNVITGARKSVRRIPLLGYILSGGKKQPSITLTVKGDLNDPVVGHTEFKKILTYPLQLLKNSVDLPAHLVSKVHQETGGSKIESSPALD